jgi:hypothetical protein
MPDDLGIPATLDFPNRVLPSTFADRAVGTSPSFLAATP